MVAPSLVHAAETPRQQFTKVPLEEINTNALFDVSLLKDNADILRNILIQQGLHGIESAEGANILRVIGWLVSARGVADRAKELGARYDPRNKNIVLPGESSFDLSLLQRLHSKNPDHVTMDTILQCALDEAPAVASELGIPNMSLRWKPAAEYTKAYKSIQDSLPVAELPNALTDAFFVAPLMRWKMCSIRFLTSFQMNFKSF